MMSSLIHGSRNFGDGHSLAHYPAYDDYYDKKMWADDPIDAERYGHLRVLREQQDSPLAEEIPSFDQIKILLNKAGSEFLRDMALALIMTGVRAHGTRDWDALAQSIVNWVSTLEVEGDVALKRRLRRRMRARATGR